MKTKSLFLTMFVMLVISFTTSAQTSVSMLVEHGTSTALNGCSEVYLKVTYTQTGGGTYLATSGVVQLDKNNSTTLATTIPSGATVLSKKIVFTFTLSSNTYSYLITDSNDTEAINFPGCSCPNDGSKILNIQEVFGRSSKVVYGLDSIGPC